MQSVSPLESWLFATTRELKYSLFALVDCAADPLLPDSVVALSPEVQYQSLFADTDLEELSDVGPGLLLLPQLPAVATRLLNQLQQIPGSGYLILSRSEPGSLAMHLRPYLQTLLPDGSRGLFRFYDPRVLLQQMPFFSLAELSRFMQSGNLLVLPDHHESNWLIVNEQKELVQKSRFL